MALSSADESLIYHVLHSRFKRNQFRSNQLEIIRAVLEQKDVMVILSTGHGKSLTFQLPAAVEAQMNGGGFYVVVSPLLALMKDQVQQLQNLGISADSINSTTTGKQRLEIMEDFAKGEGCLLYVSPEQCVSAGFGVFIAKCSEQGLVRRVVIDEAHCAVEWGSDFRKDYARLGSDFRRFLKRPVPFMALTGTASPSMQDQMNKVLQLRKAVKFTASMRRPHLHYEVRYVEDPTDRLRDLLKFLKMYRGRIACLHDGPIYPGCGIVYCRSRASTEVIASEINRELGQCAAAYHAGLSVGERNDVLAKWIAGDPMYSIVIATIAFGLGIDKPDTRFVIHFNLPNNIEAYAQQTGRGGRDRKAARCILYFSAEEAQKCVGFAKLDGEKQSAQALIKFATTISCCRHDALGTYFGDAGEGFCQFACDYCKTPQRLYQRYEQWQADL